MGEFYLFRIHRGKGKSIIKILKRYRKAEWTEGKLGKIIIPEDSGYLFVEAEDPTIMDKVEHALRKAKGRGGRMIKKNLGKVSKEKVEEYIKKRAKKEKKGHFRTGRKVVITEGPLKGKTGEIVSHTKGKEKAEVEIGEPQPMHMMIKIDRLRRL